MFHQNPISCCVTLKIIRSPKFVTAKPHRLVFLSGGRFVKLRNIDVLLSTQIAKLTEGREYIMRISAENMYGISDPLESEEMRAKDLFSMFCLIPADTHLLFSCLLILCWGIQHFMKLG